MVDRRDILLLEASVLLRDAILPQPFRQIGHIWRNESDLIKWLTLDKMGHIWRNGSNLIKRITFGKMSHV